MFHLYYDQNYQLEQLTLSVHFSVQKSKRIQSLKTNRLREAEGNRLSGKELAATLLVSTVDVLIFLMGLGEILIFSCLLECNLEPFTLISDHDFINV